MGFRRRFLPFCAGVALLCLPAAAAEGGEQLSLGERVFGADSIVEARLPLHAPIPKRWPNQTYDPKGWAFPKELIDQALKGARIERVLKAPSSGKPVLPAQPYIFSIGSPCWWMSHERGEVRSLFFLRRDGRGRWRELAGVEQEQGLYSDLNPAYEDLVAAIKIVAGWPAQAPEEARESQRRLLNASHNPYLLHLASLYLTKHAPAVLEEVWGKPGSPERRQYEKLATEPAPKNSCVPALPGDLREKIP
ncbi:MAG: hypothetical protein AB1411_03935 [Nitrospirota bacterium]